MTLMFNSAFQVSEQDDTYSHRVLACTIPLPITRTNHKQKLMQPSAKQIIITIHFCQGQPEIGTIYIRYLGPGKL